MTQRGLLRVAAWPTKSELAAHACSPPSMRLPSALTIPLSLLLLVPAVPAVPAPSDQLSFNAAFSSTIIDALNQDPDYTHLLKLLQRALLVPTINRLNGSTLFAPTNDAIERHPSWHSALQLQSLPDNRQEKLRQELLYHLLNYSIPSLPGEQSPEVHKTLHFPRDPLEPPTDEPPPSPPWLPLPGGSLGGQPQRLRVAAVEGDVNVGVDAFGKGGAKIVKGQVDAGNGMVFGMGDVLDVPPDLGEPTLLLRLSRS